MIWFLAARFTTAGNALRNLTKASARRWAGDDSDTWLSSPPCCFSNFQQLFAEGQEFSYDLDDVGRYYGDYVRLMAHWDRVLPGRVFRLQHEALLDDFEGELRRLLAYLELPFLGPSTQRDAFGIVVDVLTNPVSPALETSQRAIPPVLFLLERLDDRDRYGDAVNALLYDSLDSYAQARSLYLQNRRFELDEEDDFEFDPYEDF